MKFIITMAVMLVTALTACAQDVPGHYITASGVRAEGYFKQVNFFNETQLYFKNDVAGTYIKLDPETINEYGVTNDVKFQKYTLQVDDTKIMGTDLGNIKEAEWVTKTVFLNVILEGDASLYSYTSDKGVKFFFKVNSKNVPLSQLLYKQYMAKQNAIADNNQYRQQLYMNVSCAGQPASDFTKVRYSQKELVKIFQKYNSCNGGGETQLFSATKSKKVSFNYTVFAGIGFYTVEAQNVRPMPDKVNKTIPGFGAEVAVTLPSEKFSFFLRASYQSLSASMATVATTEIRTTTDTYTVDSNLYNFVIGPRYNFKSFVNHTFFADASYGLSIGGGDYTHEHETTVDSGTVYGPPLGYTFNKGYFFGAGIGYMYNKHYGIDARYESSRKYLSNAAPENVKAGSVSFSLRYTF